MSYQDDAARLARALTELLSPDPAPPCRLEPRQAQAALVCRDTVVGAVRDLTGALLGGVAPAPPADPDLVTRSPVHALHAALRDLAPTTGRDMALTNALTVLAGPAVTGWQSAARAAVALERYRDDASNLPGPAAWSLARDLASLSSALPHLDLDLAGTLAGAAACGGPVSSLLDGPSHGLLQLRASELTAHTADIPAAAAGLHARSGEPLRPVDQLADLPAANGQLTALLHQRGSHLTVGEIRAAVRVVAYGIDVTARALTPRALTPGARTPGARTPGALTNSRQSGQPPAGSGEPDPVARPNADNAVGQLRQTLPDLQTLMQSRLATLTPPASGVLLVSQQIHTRLAAAGRLHEALLSNASTAGTATGAGAHRALGQALTRWAVSAAPVLDAVRGALHAATQDGSLLAPRQDTARGPGAHLFWIPVQQTDAAPHPALHAADRAAGGLRVAATSLTAMLDPAAVGRLSGAQRAAGDAASAFGELTVALQSRPRQSWPNPTRTAHPALPGPTSRQHPSRP